MTPLELVLHYHDETKHHPQRYARSSGYLDWASQPNPFRSYAGARFVPLPLLDRDDSPPFEDLFVPGAVPPAPLTLASVSELFFRSLAISAWKQAGGVRWALRCNPSSGNLHPTEGYAVLPALSGVSVQAGVYHYCAQRHGLEQRTAFATQVWEELAAALSAPLLLIGITTIHWREAWKYGERAFRYCQHDIGHALGALRFAAASLGWRLALLDEFGDDQVGSLLGVDRDIDFADAEREEPALLAAVYPPDRTPQPERRGAAAALRIIAEGTWFGQANGLSAAHVAWDMIDLVADAARRPPTGAIVPVPASGAAQSTVTTDYASAAKPPKCGLSARQIFRRRRSAVNFDGQTGLSADGFFHMLRRTLGATGGSDARTVPFDAIPWPPTIHLFLFVHLIRDIPSGLYAFVRDAGAVARLRSATKPAFAWSRETGVPADLPLFLLERGDCRRAAAQLSLGQAIAGTSAFSLGMVADFERPLGEYGPWFYRRLFWEAGLIGQVLYLEAEAAGVRSTGIGAYFDDWVHDVLGLRGRAFQSLYHFTVGGPVEDQRITTLPAYAGASA